MDEVTASTCPSVNVTGALLTNTNKYQDIFPAKSMRAKTLTKVAFAQKANYKFHLKLAHDSHFTALKTLSKAHVSIFKHM